MRSKSNKITGTRCLCAFVAAATALPLLRGKAWWIRIFDFPRLQILALGAGVLGSRWLRQRPRVSDDAFWFGLTGAAVAAQAMQIFPYTRFCPREVLSAPRSASGARITLLCANVYQYNRRAARLLSLIDRHRPDLILLTETDAWWASQLQPLRNAYPWIVSQPQENTYGMILFSRFKLLNPQVRFLVHSDIPSIRTLVQPAENESLLFHGLHPKPPATPTPQGELRGSGGRDTELLLIARETRQTSVPIIVAGDFNDVAWSHTTRLFRRISRLLDPRIGRGLYNTFPVAHPWLRYPLDHLFHSSHFTLRRFTRLPSIGSDHFPILASLRLQPSAAKIQSPPPPSREDLNEAKQTIEESPKD